MSDVKDHFDGSFYAKGRAVFRRPLRHAGGITMGFRLCVLDQDQDELAADEIAAALNAFDVRAVDEELDDITRQEQQP